MANQVVAQGGDLPRSDYVRVRQPVSGGGGRSGGRGRAGRGPGAHDGGADGGVDGPTTNDASMPDECDQWSCEGCPSERVGRMFCEGKDLFGCLVSAHPRCGIKCQKVPLKKCTRCTESGGVVTCDATNIVPQDTCKDLPCGGCPTGGAATGTVSLDTDDLTILAGATFSQGAASTQVSGTLSLQAGTWTEGAGTLVFDGAASDLQAWDGNDEDVGNVQVVAAANVAPSPPS